jgi:4'-phosphopantetheinyl transferase EntD
MPRWVARHHATVSHPVEDSIMDGPLFADLAGILVECLEVADHVEALFPEERAIVARAVPKRQREFASGRMAAHRLFDRLGLPRRPVLADAHRAPIWPADGVVSISHTGRWAAAAYAPKSRATGLGIDIETRGRVTARLMKMVLTQTEIERCDHGRDVELATLLFSAKESIYKAVQPLLQGFIGFHEVEIEPQHDAFCARYCGRRDLARLIDAGEGRWGGTAELAASLFAVTAPRR